MQPAVQTIPDPLLQQVSGRIEDRTGLHFPRARLADLERGLVQAAREVGCRDARAYAESLLNRDLHAADLEILAGSLTIGETHFFRDPRAFEFLETTLLPELIAARRGGDRRLRIWSAGCATGEEPYSIAILLHRLLPDLSDWHITILGTDINPKVLARAASGLYTEWSFRDTPDWVKPRYFTARAGGRYEIQPWLKRMVGFACLNLAEDVYPSLLNNTNAMDLIICRNVLLYFAPARIPQVVQRFHRALIDGGQLVMGAVEASQMTFPEFTPVPAPGVALYRKECGTRNAERGTGNEENAEGGVRNGERGMGKAQGGTRNAEVPSHIVSSSAFPVPRSALPTPQSLYAAGRYQEARAAPGRNRRSTRPRPKARAPHSAFRVPRSVDPHSAILLAHCHANLGELAEALVWCERALATAKTDPTLHFLRAGILQELQHDEEALLALRNVLFLDPGHVLAHFIMANLHRRHNRKPAAAKHLANVRQLLAQRDENEELPQSGGLTVGRLNAILAAMENAEVGTRNAEGKTLELWTPRSELPVPSSAFRVPRSELQPRRGMTHE